MEEKDTYDVSLKLWRHFFESIGWFLLAYITRSSCLSRCHLWRHPTFFCQGWYILLCLSVRTSQTDSLRSGPLWQRCLPKRVEDGLPDTCVPHWGHQHLGCTSGFAMLCIILCAIFFVIQIGWSNTRSCPLEPKMLIDNSCAVENITSYLGEKKQSHFSELPEIDLSDSKVSRFSAIKAPSDFYFSANLNSRSQISISKFHHK